MKDVIVIGGGPAGAGLAYRLARKGIAVLLLEKSEFPRFIPCAGGITRKVMRELAFDLSPVIEDKITRFVFTSNLASPVEAITAESFVYTVRREKFDALLLKEAASAGAEIITGTRVRKIESCNGVFHISTGERIYRCKILAGADGAHSIVARTFSLDGRINRGVTLDCRLSLPTEKEAWFCGTIRVDYGLLRQGYAWLFPKKDCLTVGAGAMQGSPGEIRSALNEMIRVIDFNKETEMIFPERGWLLPVNPFPQRLHSGAALLLGDAAGLVDPFTGEGIYNALKSARLAAAIIEREIRNPYPDLRGYSTLVKSEMGPDLAAAWRLSRLFFRRAPFFHRLLQRHPELAGEFLELLAGQSSYPHFLRRCLNLLLRESLNLLQPT